MRAVPGMANARANLSDDPGRGTVIAVVAVVSVEKWAVLVPSLFPQTGFQISRFKGYRPEITEKYLHYPNSSCHHHVW